MMMRDYAKYVMYSHHTHTLQDLATHTRISPNHRELLFRKFLERVNSTPKVRKN